MPPHLQLAIASGVVLAACAYYAVRWPSFAAFVEAIDYMPYLQDFTGHYYPMGRQILHDPAPVAGYPYPSFFAVLLAPLGALELSTAVVIWTVLQLALAAALCRLSALGGAPSTAFGTAAVVGLVVTSTPVLSNLKWGQVSVLITVCVIAAALVGRRDRTWASGALLGFATAVKMYPGLFGVLFLLRRQWRAFAVFALATIVCYVVVPVIVLGPAGWWRFEQAIAVGAKNLDVTGNVNSQNFANVASRWIFLATGAPAAAGLLATLRLVGHAFGIGCLLLAMPLCRRDPAASRVLPLVAVFLSLPFLLETSWPHYFSHLPFCQIAMLASARAFADSPVDRGATWRWRAIATLTFASVALASVFCLDLSGHWSTYYGYGTLFVANLLLLVALGIVASSPPVALNPRSELVAAASPSTMPG